MCIKLLQLSDKESEDMQMLQIEFEDQELAGRMAAAQEGMGTWNIAFVV